MSTNLPFAAPRPFRAGGAGTDTPRGISASPSFVPQARACLAALLVGALGLPLLAQQAPNPGGSKLPANTVFVPLKNAQTPEEMRGGRSGSLVTQRMPSPAVIEAQRVLLDTLVKEVTELKARVAALEAAARPSPPPQPQPAPPKQ